LVKTFTAMEKPFTKAKILEKSVTKSGFSARGRFQSGQLPLIALTETENAPEQMVTVEPGHRLALRRIAR